jgi:hypoxanthine phosphoribosyltransferase
MSGKKPTRHEILTWSQVDEIVDNLVPQLQSVGTFGAMVMITRGGVIPGGLLAEALDIQHLLTAAVDFPSTEAAGLMAWPSFLQFPADALLDGRKTLIVDDVWGSGRTSTSVRERVVSAGATPFTCVFHFNPYRSLFSKARPDFYGVATDAYITYPWEIDRGPRGWRMTDPSLEPS